MPTSLRIEATADQHFMRMALELAESGRGRVEPNPMVGCVIVRGGVLIGQGFHGRFGGPHAEIEALHSIESTASAKGATAYVSLEPCCHHGKTPPCSRALVDAGIARVVVAMPDPFPRVDGGGLGELAEAGVATTVGVLGQQAELLNAPYLKRIRTGKPWVIAKWAMTIDGRIATVGGESQWITGPLSRQQVHRLRARVDAIAVGMGTVQADDPMLTARPSEPDQTPARIATRVVFCRNRLPSINSKLVQSARDFPLMLIAGSQIDADSLVPLETAGAVLIHAETDDPNEMVHTALLSMGEREMTNLMLEGGGELLSSFFAAGQIDEFHVYLGPKLFGGQHALGPVGGVGIHQISDAWTLSLVSMDQFDDDLRAVYRKIDKGS